MKHLKNFNESKNNKLKEYDVVKLKVEVDNIPVGTEGTIVHINKKAKVMKSNL